MDFAKPNYSAAVAFQEALPPLLHFFPAFRPPFSALYDVPRPFIRHRTESVLLTP